MSTDKSTHLPEMASGKASSGTTTSSRKPYQSPRLTVYGSIQKLTNTISSGKKMDGGGMSMNMRTCL